MGLAVRPKSKSETILKRFLKGVTTLTYDDDSATLIKDNATWMNKWPISSITLW